MVTPTMFHMSGVRCHVLRAMCQVSGVRWQVSCVGLVGGGSVINTAYPVYFLPLGRDEVTITLFSSIHVLITGPALYKKTPP